MNFIIYKKATKIYSPENIVSQYHKSLKMADLYQVYSNYGGYAENFQNEEEEEQPVNRRAGSRAVAQAQEQAVQQKAQQAQAMQQVAPPQNNNNQQVGTGKQGSQAGTEHFSSYRRSNDYSFWDKMSMKRPEVVKLAVFSLVIVLAISIDRIGTHYLTKYITDNIFTNFQEFMLRLSYPVIVVLILWIIKAV